MKSSKSSPLVRFGLFVASAVLGIILFIAVTATALIADFQLISSGDNIRDLVREVFTEFMSAPVKTHVTTPVNAAEGGLRIAPRPSRTYSMPRREEASSVADSLTNQLIGMFYDQVTDQIGEDFPVTKEEFTQLINESTVKDYVVDKTADLITDFVMGEVTTTFEPEEIVGLINENSDLIVSITGEPLPEDVVQQVAQVFDENEIIQKVEAEGLAGFMEITGEEIPGLPSEGSGSSLDSIMNGETSIDINGIMDALRDATSVGNLIWGIVICLALIAAIILVNIRQLSKGLRRAGYPLLLAGLGVVPCMMANLYPDAWTLFPGMSVVRQICAQVTVVYATIFGLGLALFIAGIVLGTVMRVKSKFPVSTPTTPETDALADALVEDSPVDFASDADTTLEDAEPSAYSTSVNE